MACKFQPNQLLLSWEILFLKTLIRLVIQILKQYSKTQPEAIPKLVATFRSMLSTWPKDGHMLWVSCTPLHLCSCSWVLSGSRSTPWPGFPMSFSFQNFGIWPIYDIIFFRYMICYGRLVHFCCPALSVWPCERSVANRFYFFSVFILSLPIISASLSNICTVAVVAWRDGILEGQGYHLWTSYVPRQWDVSVYGRWYPHVPSPIIVRVWPRAYAAGSDIDVDASDARHDEVSCYIHGTKVIENESSRERKFSIWTLRMGAKSPYGEIHNSRRLDSLHNIRNFPVRVQTLSLLTLLLTWF